MSRKPTQNQGRAGRATKVQALIKRPGTAGEQQAAEAALERLSVPLVRREAQGAHLTDPIVRALPPPAKGNKIVFDGSAGVPGFGVRVTAAGAKAFVIDYRVRGSGQQRRHTIGQFPSWSTSAARAEAKRLRQIVDGGGDPRADIEESREAPTMANLADRFEKDYLPRKRPTTQTSYSDLLRLYIRPFFGKHTKVGDVKYTDIDRLHRKVTAAGPGYSANRVVSIVSKMFSYAAQLEWRTVNTNPCKGVERNPEIKRRRYLSDDELVRLTAALAKYPNKQFADIIKLLMLTGARRGEILAMRWLNLDLERGIWSKPAAAVKQARAHTVPLSEAAVAVLRSIDRGDGDFVFHATAGGKSGHVTEVKTHWANLLRDAGIAGLRIHDLRHSFASQLVSGGASLPLIGELLGHSNPAVTSRYAHLRDDVTRAAVEVVSGILSNAGGGRRS